MDKKTQLNIMYAMSAVFAVMFFQHWLTERPVKELLYSEFEQLLKDKQIEEVYVHLDSLEGKLKTPLPDGQDLFVTPRVDPQLADHLSQSEIKFTGVTDSSWLRDLLSWVLPALLFFALWQFFFRRLVEKQGLGGLMTVGKSKAKVYVVKESSPFSAIPRITAAWAHTSLREYCWSAHQARGRPCSPGR
ncbi:MAG: hypothetical protein HY268_01040 [Deltaproteobacteria bacterium]|nr:hypothetical protein [Deltaproteobacteria bacterium]